MEIKFYKCNKCGQIVRKIKDTKVPLVCCGEEMIEITPKEHEEGLSEKHIPVYKLKKNKVITCIGSVIHPSTNDHYIEWILLETNSGSHLKSLKPGDYPEAIFELDDGEEVVAIYAYCNIHSLWVYRPKKVRSCGCSIK